MRVYLARMRIYLLETEHFMLSLFPNLPTCNDSWTPKKEGCCYFVNIVLEHLRSAYGHGLILLD